MFGLCGTSDVSRVARNILSHHFITSRPPAKCPMFPALVMSTSVAWANALRSAKPRLASEISYPYAYLYAPTVTIAVVVILLFI